MAELLTADTIIQLHLIFPFLCFFLPQEETSPT